MYLDEIYSEGKDLQRLTVDLLEHFRRLLLIKMVRDAEAILQVSDDLYQRLSGQAGRFKTSHLLHIIKELMELRQSVRDAGMERLLWESSMVKLTRWEVSPNLDGLNRRIQQLEQALAGGGIPPHLQMAPPVQTPPPMQVQRPPAPQPMQCPPVSKPVPGPPPIAQTVKPPAATPVREIAAAPQPERQRQATQQAAAPAPVEVPVPTRSSGPTINDAGIWHQLLRMAKKERMDIFSILQAEGAGTLEGDQYRLKLGGKNTFNRDFLEKNRRYIEDILGRILNRKVHFVLEVTEDQGRMFERNEKPHQVFVQEIIDIFGASPVDKPI